MILKTDFFKNIVRSSKFWQHNYIFLREFKYFGLIALLAIVFSILGAVFEGIALGVINLFLQYITSYGSSSPAGTGWIDTFVLGIQSTYIERLNRLGLLVIIAAFLRSIFSYWAAVFALSTEASFGDRLHKSMFQQLISVSLSYYSNSKSGDLINSMTHEIAQIQRSFSSASSLGISVATLMVYIISMFVISWQLSIIALILFGALSLFISKFGIKVRELSFPTSQAYSVFASRTLEFINGIRTIQTSCTQTFERERFYKSSLNLKKTHLNLFSYMSLVRPLAESISTAILIGIILVAFNFLVIGGKLEISALLTLMFVLFRMMPLVQQVNGIRTELAGFAGSYSKIRSILQEEDKVYLLNGSLEFKRLDNSIDFLSVDFSYSADQPILQDINLSIKCGQTTALVGTSGAGKTTLADLIPRLYDPTQGRILIDGIDLRDLEINSLRRKMAIVSQDTFIFNASVRDNIAYGVDIVDEIELKEAAKQANALDFILEMTEGFDTILGDRGVRLSGGQRQRIAIARALMRNPEILVLDEATSALDSVTEKLIQESLENLSKGCTVIMIAHRLSTIVRADKVVVLEKGRIVEQGTYSELIEKKGSLWKYHQMQNESSQS
jgi:ATP-binding cassette, subfamily B, bacterial MsbA